MSKMADRRTQELLKGWLYTFYAYSDSPADSHPPEFHDVEWNQDEACIKLTSILLTAEVHARRLKTAASYKEYASLKAAEKIISSALVRYAVPRTTGMLALLC